MRNDRRIQPGTELMEERKLMTTGIKALPTPTVAVSSPATTENHRIRVSYELPSDQIGEPFDDGLRLIQTNGKNHIGALN
jgi:hypothetical protein